MEKALKALARALGGNDPNSQVMSLLNPSELVANGPLAKALQSIAKRIPNPIKAYHGSPHDFEQFSLDKIGTGEGAQAYGHGLYFAENPAVAGDYQKKLSTFGHASEMPESMETSILLDGKVVNGKTPSNQLTPIERAALAAHYDRGAHRAIQSIEKETIPYLTGEALQQEMETLAALKSNDFTGRIQPFKGRMYEVNIHADPNDLLDWDAPLSQQSEKTRKAMDALHEQAGPVQPVKLRDGGYSVTKVSPDGSGRVVWDVHAKTPEEALAQYQQYRTSASGGEVYHDLTRANYGKEMRPPQASDVLKQQGIAGIKYLDGVSRKAGEGSRNYVIFDDKLIEIVKKYGIAGAIAKGLLSETQARQLSDQGYQ